MALILGPGRRIGVTREGVTAIYTLDMRDEMPRMLSAASVETAGCTASVTLTGQHTLSLSVSDVTEILPSRIRLRLEADDQVLHFNYSVIGVRA